jgi:putative oxidoreductase
MTIQYPDLAALILRLGFGLYMLIGHGYGKLLNLLSGDEIKFFSFLGLSPKISLSLAVFAEFVACIFIIIGYKTRLATLPLIFTMLVAAFMVHGGDPWFMYKAEGGSKEPAMIYLIGFLSIYLLGSGKYSADDRSFNVV